MKLVGFDASLVVKLLPLLFYQRANADGQEEQARALLRSFGYADESHSAYGYMTEAGVEDGERTPLDASYFSRAMFLMGQGRAGARGRTPEDASTAEAIARAFSQRGEIEESGNAPHARDEQEAASSTLLYIDGEDDDKQERSGASSGTPCRITNLGITCESPDTRAYRVATEVATGRRRRKRRKKKKRKRSKWKDNGKGMMCNGWKCVPIPTKVPRTTTAQPLWEGNLENVYRSIKLSDLKKKLEDLDRLHPLSRFLYLNLNGNRLTGDINVLREILCKMPNIRYVSLQACALIGTLPENLFECTQKITKLDIAENGIWCLKHSLDFGLTPKSYGTRRAWSVVHVNFRYNPMMAQLKWDSQSSPEYISEDAMDWLSMAKKRKVAVSGPKVSEWADKLREAINNEENCNAASATDVKTPLIIN